MAPRCAGTTASAAPPRRSDQDAAAPGSGVADPEALTDPVGHGAITGPGPAVDRHEWPLPRYPRAVWEFDAGSDGG